MVKILIIEDESDVAKSMQGILKDAGFEVELAIGGQQGLDKLDAADPDIVLLDIIMPIVDGVEVLREIRNRRGSKSLPVLVVTAVSAEVGVKSDVEAIDPDVGFIEKPFHAEDIIAAVKRMLK